MSASLLARLIEAGLPAELIAEVAQLEARADIAERTLEGRRAGDRARKQEQRRRDAAGVDGQSQDVTGRHVTSGDAADIAPLPLPPNERISNPPTPAPGNNTPRVKAEPFPRPEWAEPAVWADFLKNRKTKRLSNTATAHSGMLEDIAAISARCGWPPGKVLAACVAKGWGAIYETDEMRAASNGNGNGGDRRGNRGGRDAARDSRDGFARELDEQIARHRKGAAGRPGAGEAGGGGLGTLAAPAAVR